MIYDLVTLTLVFPLHIHPVLCTPLFCFVFSIKYIRVSMCLNRKAESI